MGRRLTGWIRERRGRWELFFGRQLYGAFDTWDEADRIRKAELLARAGDVPDRFALFGEDWLAKRELVAQRNNSHRVWVGERDQWRCHVATARWYDLPFRALTPRIMQAWVNELDAKRALQTSWRYERDGIQRTRIKVLTPTDRQLSATRVRDVINLAARCLDAAIVAGKLAGIKVNGVVQGNPLRMVVRPSRVERIGKVSRVTDAKGPDRHRHIRNDDPDSMQRIVFLTAREIDRLLACDLPPHVRLAYVLALYTGLRRSELAGLQWGDVVRLTGNQPELQVRYGYDRPLKSESAVREVPLLAPARQALIDYRKLLGVLPTPDRHVFLKSDAAAWCQQIRTASPGERYAYTYDWAWRASWRARSGIRRVVTFHAFRHTCGSHLVQGTWTPRPLALSRVKLWLGHSSERVTERHYAALSKDNLHADVGHSLHTDVGHGVTR